MSSIRRAAVPFVACVAFFAAHVAHASSPVPPGAVPPRARDPKVGLIVKLDAEPVATYRGGVAGLAATARVATGSARLAASSTAVSAYRKHLARRIGDFERDLAAAVPGARVLHRFDVIVGGAALLRLHAEIRTALSDGALTMGHARALLSLTDEAAQRRVGRDVIARGLSVRETEALVRDETTAKSDAPEALKPKVDPNTRAAEEQLKLALGTRVRIVRKGKGGRIEVDFTNEEELQRLFEKLTES